MKLRTSAHDIADVTLEPHDFNLDGTIKNINALMCRQVSSVAFPLPYAGNLFDAYFVSAVKSIRNRPALLYYCFSQVKQTLSYDIDVATQQPDHS